MTERFYGKNIYLRKLVGSDVTNGYLLWFADPDVTRFLEAKNLTKKEVIDYINYGKKSGTYYMYAICDKTTNKHIGNLKMGPIVHKFKISDMVVVIGDKNYWGKGIASEAIKIGNKIAFELYDIRKLSGAIYSSNMGSIKCYIKGGWIIEGILKGHLICENKIVDKVCVSCFNPKYFDLDKIIPSYDIINDQIVEKQK